MIGGGIIGLSTAWRLKQRGLSVAVMDAGAMASEASMAAAGMLAPGGEAHGASTWAQSAIDARKLYAEFVAELKGASGLEIDFRECGALEIASTESVWADLERFRPAQQSLGIEVREISETDARSLVPLLHPGSIRALYYPGDAIVNPIEVCTALQAVLRRDGVALLAGNRVEAVEADGDGYRIQSETVPPGGASLWAESVVLAAGAWSSQIALPDRVTLRSPRRQALPVRGHLVECQRAPGTIGPIVRENHLYILQRGNGDVLAGSTEERVGFDRAVNPAAVENILERTSRLLPSLFDPALESSAWLGFRPGIEGEGPELRQLSGERIWLAYGHYRNGILLAPHTAAFLANEISA